MGLCKSRQQEPKFNYAIPQKMVAQEQTFRAPPGLGKPSRSNLRLDAQPFHPDARTVPGGFPDGEGEKENWEAFLDKKQAEVLMQKTPGSQGARLAASGQLPLASNGSFTSRYTDMLGEQTVAKRYPWKKPAAERDFDILKSWRNAAPKATPFQYTEEKALKQRKITPLKKQIIAQREEQTSNPLWTKFADHLQSSKEENRSPVVEKRETKDDLQQKSDIVPYGLADRHYLSDTEDSSDAHRHVETSHGLIREYVDTAITPELEEAATACLYQLRQLKMQEIAIGHPNMRYAVGFREVGRRLQQHHVAAMIVAPDIEKTSGGALENKILALKNQCEYDNVPVIFALSRRQLGAAIQKNVSISVLAILETRGAEKSFEHILEEVKRAREIEA